MSPFLFHHFFVEHLDVETPRSSGSRASEIVLELDLVPMANGGWCKGFTIKIGNWKGTKNSGMILINGICLMIYGTGLPLSNLTLKYGKSPDLSIDVLFFPGACSVAVKLSPQRPGLATSGHRWPRGTNTLQSVIPKNKNYLTSSYPHHDIYTFCYWQIFWHSIWHIFWHSIWHIFWHSIWHTFWHSIWHIFWHSIWHIFWHSTWHIFWHMFWHSIWHIFWHSFWHSIWHSIWQIFWRSIWQTFWHFIWHIFWHSFWHSIWRSIWHIFWHSIWPLRSSGAHWARRVPGWGPAVLTELGGSEVEVQRCSLSSDGPRLRSSGAHWARKVPGWGPAVQRLRSQTLAEVQQCPLRAKLAKSLAKSWQGGSEHGSGGRGGGGEGGGEGEEQLW